MVTQSNLGSDVLSGLIGSDVPIGLCWERCSNKGRCEETCLRHGKLWNEIKTYSVSPLSPVF
jgi:hypothetical protein